MLLGDIHTQWRIDIRSFTNVEGGVSCQGSEIESLLKDFHDKYKHMPLVQQEDSQKQIAHLVHSQTPFTVKPNSTSQRTSIGFKETKV